MPPGGLYELETKKQNTHAPHRWFELSDSAVFKYSSDGTMNPNLFLNLSVHVSIFFLSKAR
jgi:hypothetical protein